MAYGDLNYSTNEINADLAKVHDKEAIVEEAPSNGNQYGRKDGVWTIIDTGGAQYLDLSMFSADNGTLSEEDYQKVVKAYEDGINTILYNGYLFPSIFFNSEGNIMISIYLIMTSEELTDVLFSCAYITLNSDKTYNSKLALLASFFNLQKSGKGTKALTDNGQYADFAKPITSISGSSGAVTKELSPNTYYKFGECTSLTITLGAEVPGILNEYMFEFVSGATATVLGLPETVKWNNGNAPTIEANKTYIVAIVNNIAVIGGA